MSANPKQESTGLLMAALEGAITDLVNSVVDERLAVIPRQGGQAAVDDDTRKQIARYELIAHKTYLNKKEIALYIGCSDRSVEEWAVRGVNDNPLPVGYAGSDMRAKREGLDRWIEREAQRKRLRLAS